MLSVFTKFAKDAKRESFRCEMKQRFHIKANTRHLKVYFCRTILGHLKKMKKYPNSLLFQKIILWYTFTVHTENRFPESMSCYISK